LKNEELSTTQPEPDIYKTRKDIIYNSRKVELRWSSFLRKLGSYKRATPNGVVRINIFRVVLLKRVIVKIIEPRRRRRRLTFVTQQSKK
jgi:hypothetical protein